MDEREPRRRAVTPEWAAQVTDELRAITTKLDRVLTHLGLNDGQSPNTMTHDPERGTFSPGTGWIPDEPPAHYEPRASEQTAYEAMAAARAAIKRTGDE